MNRRMIIDRLNRELAQLSKELGPCFETSRHDEITKAIARKRRNLGFLMLAEDRQRRPEIYAKENR